MTTHYATSYPRAGGKLATLFLLQQLALELTQDEDIAKTIVHSLIIRTGNAVFSHPSPESFITWARTHLSQEKEHLHDN